MHNFSFAPQVTDRKTGRHCYRYFVQFTQLHRSQSLKNHNEPALQRNESAKFAISLTVISDILLDNP